MAVDALVAHNKCSVCNDRDGAFIVATPDLNLLLTLDAILAEGSVVGAARRLRLSPSAVSRGLERLRGATGDPLLVRAGRGLVPTPRAHELRERVSHLVQEAEAVLRPAARPDLGKVVRTFTLRTSEGFVENFGPALISRVGAEAPGIRLRFLQRVSRDSGLLRDGTVDLETGVVGDAASPELRVQPLFKDRFIAVARADHALAKRKLTPATYAAARHIVVSRGELQGPIDDALAALGFERRAVTIVSGFATAIALARATDLVATVPERHTEQLRMGMRSFTLPFEPPGITVSAMWHPRLHTDPVHRWLRGVLREVCGARS